MIRIFEQYALRALEKQEQLAQYLGDHAMELDLDAGVVRFTGNIEFPFQVLGTESDNTLTWLWAWSEEQTEVPENLTQAARELRAWGEQNNLEEFTLPSIDLDRADGTMFSLIASEVCSASCYYRDQYEGGSLFVLLTGRAITGQPGFDRAGLVRRFRDLTTLYEFDHRKALSAYFRSKNLPWSQANMIGSGELANGERLVAEFNEKGRLRSINGEDVE